MQQLWIVLLFYFSLSFTTVLMAETSSILSPNYFSLCPGDWVGKMKFLWRFPHKAKWDYFLGDKLLAIYSFVGSDQINNSDLLIYCLDICFLISLHLLNYYYNYSCYFYRFQQLYYYYSKSRGYKPWGVSNPFSKHLSFVPWWDSMRDCPHSSPSWRSYIKKNKLYGTFLLDGVQLPQGYRTTTRTQFTFYH